MPQRGSVLQPNVAVSATLGYMGQKNVYRKAVESIGRMNFRVADEGGNPGLKGRSPVGATDTW